MACKTLELSLASSTSESFYPSAVVAIRVLAIRGDYVSGMGFLEIGVGMSTTFRVLCAGQGLVTGEWGKLGLLGQRGNLQSFFSALPVGCNVDEWRAVWPLSTWDSY